MANTTKSTVLLKHHLKQLKLPTMLAECEKVAARAGTFWVPTLTRTLPLANPKAARKAKVTASANEKPLGLWL